MPPQAKHKDAEQQAEQQAQQLLYYAGLYYDEQPTTWKHQFGPEAARRHVLQTLPNYLRTAYTLRWASGRFRFTPSMQTIYVADEPELLIPYVTLLHTSEGREELLSWLQSEDRSRALPTMRAVWEFGVMHEFGHVIFGHAHRSRRGERDLELWKVANDYVVNGLLWIPLIARIRSRWDVTPAAMYYDRRFDGLSCEEVYDILERLIRAKLEHKMEHKMELNDTGEGIREQTEGTPIGVTIEVSGNGGSDGISNGISIEAGEETLEGMREQTDDDAGEGIREQTDDDYGEAYIDPTVDVKRLNFWGEHDEHDTLTNAEATGHDELVKAASYAPSHGSESGISPATEAGPGNDPFVAQYRIEAALALTPAHWLNRLMAVAQQRRRTYKHRARRFIDPNVISPGRERIVGRVFVAVDVSGSVESFVPYFTERVQTLLSLFELSVVTFDHRLQQDFRLTQQDKLPELNYTGGGTSYVSVWARLKELQPSEQFMAAIYFTDLCVNVYDVTSFWDPHIPVFWVLPMDIAKLIGAFDDIWGQLPRPEFGEIIGDYFGPKRAEMLARTLSDMTARSAAKADGNID